MKLLKTIKDLFFNFIDNVTNIDTYVAVFKGTLAVVFMVTVFPMIFMMCAIVVSFVLLVLTVLSLVAYNPSEYLIDRSQMVFSKAGDVCSHLNMATSEAFGIDAYLF